MTGEHRSVELILIVAVSALALGGILYLVGAHDAANVVWAIVTVGGLVRGDVVGGRRERDTAGSAST